MQEYTTNEAVLIRIGKDKEVVYTKERRKLANLRHKMKNNEYRLVADTPRGRIEAKRGLSGRHY